LRPSTASSRKTKKAASLLDLQPLHRSKGVTRATNAGKT
jgi:hypothetical protein